MVVEQTEKSSFNETDIYVILITRKFSFSTGILLEPKLFDVDSEQWQLKHQAENVI